MRHGLNDLLEVFVIQFIRSLPVGQWLINSKLFFISFAVISIQSRVWLGYWIAFGADLSDQRRFDTTLRIGLILVLFD